MKLIDFIESNPYNTDKIKLGYVHEFYDKIFSPRRGSVRNVLELGISNGASILLWRDFFSYATVQGIDINSCQGLNGQSQIVQNIQDGYTPYCYNNLPNNFFDIVIDDGPHTYESMVVFLTEYFCKVKDGGLMILEDIVDPSWTPKLLDLIDTNACKKIEVVHMANKQRDSNLNDLWKNGLDVIIIEK